jgi:hypothetical protein
MPLYIIVINPILYYWATVVLLILLVVIGFKKSNGLWSQERYYSGSRPQQQQFYGGGQVQGQGVPISQLTGAGSNKPSLQPAQAEIIGGASPTWRAELTGVNYTNPTQQYYGTQYQQQLPVMQNEVTQAYGSGTQNEMA